MSDQIKPRIDETGVPLCAWKTCPSRVINKDGEPACSIDGRVHDRFSPECLPAIRAMAADAALGRRVRAMPTDFMLLRGFEDWYVAENRAWDDEVKSMGDTPEAALDAAGIGEAKER